MYVPVALECLNPALNRSIFVLPSQRDTSIHIHLTRRVKYILICKFFTDRTGETKHYYHIYFCRQRTFTFSNGSDPELLKVYFYGQALARELCTLVSLKWTVLQRTNIMLFDSPSTSVVFPRTNIPTVTDSCIALWYVAKRNGKFLVLLWSVDKTCNVFTSSRIILGICDFISWWTI
jgi:hypothetical protein